MDGRTCRLRAGDLLGFRRKLRRSNPATGVCRSRFGAHASSLHNAGGPPTLKRGSIDNSGAGKLAHRSNLADRRLDPVARSQLQKNYCLDIARLQSVSAKDLRKRRGDRWTAWASRSTSLRLR